MKNSKLSIDEYLHIKFDSVSMFAKDAVALILGTSIAQAFPMLFYPILGRIFTPAEFGLLATLNSITAVLVVLSTGTYEKSILITETNQDATNIIGLVLLVSFSFLLASLIGLGLFLNPISLWFDDTGIKKWLFISPLSAFVIVIYDCYNEWCVRNRYFVSLSWNKMINSSSNVLCKLLFGIVKLTSNGLIIGDFIGRTFSASICVFRALIKDKEAFFQISLANMSRLAKRYIEFPKYLLPGQLIDTINSQLSIIMIASFFSSTEVGYYSMAGNLLSVPASVISVAVRDVFRQRANEEWVKKRNCINIYKNVIRMMFFTIVPISILLMFILPSLFSFLLGDNWDTAGNYARILMPNVVILFMFQVVSAVFIIANKMKESFIWQIYSISLTVVSLCIGCFIFKDIQLTLIAYVLARCIANLTRFYLTYQYSKGIKV